MRRFVRDHKPRPAATATVAAPCSRGPPIPIAVGARPASAVFSCPNAHLTQPLRRHARRPDRLRPDQERQRERQRQRRPHHRDDHDDRPLERPDPGDDDSAVPFDPIETTVAFIVTSPDLPPGDCDPWAEDCPDGQKCAPFATPGSPTWDAVQCVPIVDDPAPAGAPCSVLDHPTSGLDDCVKHAMCWDLGPDLHGTCVAMCLGDGFNQASCLDPDNLCVQANDNVILVCLPRCDPLLGDCPEGQVCIPSATDFACAPDASGAGGQAFTPCAAGNTCDPGLLCADSSHTALCDPDLPECCLPFCDLDQFDSCPPDTACIPVFDEGGVEPHLLDVGLCGEP